MLRHLFGMKYPSRNFFLTDLNVEIHTVVFWHGCLPLSQNIVEAKIRRQKIFTKEAFEACGLSSDKFEAYLAEKLLSLRFVVLFVMGKGIHECNTNDRNERVTTATNTFCLEVAVIRESNHGFAPLNCDFEKNKAAVVMLYNVVQFWVWFRRPRLKIEFHFR